MHESLKPLLYLELPVTINPQINAFPPLSKKHPSYLISQNLKQVPALPLFYGRVTRQQRIIHVGLVVFNHSFDYQPTKAKKSPYNKELINLKHPVSI